MSRAAICPLMTHSAENPARLAIDDIPAIAMPASPPAAKTPNPHSSAQAARGFVLGRFSYAYRHPKTFTMYERALAREVLGLGRCVFDKLLSGVR